MEIPGQAREDNKRVERSVRASKPQALSWGGGESERSWYVLV